MIREENPFNFTSKIRILLATFFILLISHFNCRIQIRLLIYFFFLPKNPHLSTFIEAYHHQTIKQSSKND